MDCCCSMLSVTAHLFFEPIVLAKYSPTYEYTGCSVKHVKKTLETHSHWKQWVPMPSHSLYVFYGWSCFVTDHKLFQAFPLLFFLICLICPIICHCYLLCCIDLVVCSQWMLCFMCGESTCLLLVYRNSFNSDGNASLTNAPHIFYLLNWLIINK